MEQNYLKLMSDDFDERMEAILFFLQGENQTIPKKVFDRVYELLKEDKEITERIWSCPSSPAEPLVNMIPNQWKYHFWYSGEWLFQYNEGLGKILLKSCLPDYADLAFNYARKWEDIKCYKTDRAIEEVISRLNEGAYYYIDIARELFLEEETLKNKPGARERIKKALMTLGMEGNERALESLGDCGDPDLLPYLENILKLRPEDLEISDPDEDRALHRKIFVLNRLKDAARKSIEKIKDKNKLN